MEAQVETANENYTDKIVESNSVNAESTNTAFSGNDTVSYTSFVAPEDTTSIPTNNEIDNSYNAQEFTMDTTTLTFSENYPTESVSDFNDGGNSKVEESEVQAQPFVTEEQANDIEMDTSEVVDKTNDQFIENDYNAETDEFKIVEIQTDNEHKSEELPEESSNIIIEEPVENTDDHNVEETVREVIENVEIHTDSLHEVEDPEKVESNVLVTEVDEENDTNVVGIENVDEHAKCEDQSDANQHGDLEIDHTVHKDIVGNVDELSMDESTEIAEGKFFLF